MLCNRIDTESKKMTELPDGSPGCKLVIKAMDQQILFLETRGHEGPIKITVDFDLRS
jgi:hypothetical protein